jgi:hypothetical protein
VLVIIVVGGGRDPGSNQTVPGAAPGISADRAARVRELETEITRLARERDSYQKELRALDAERHSYEPALHRCSVCHRSVGATPGPPALPVIAYVDLAAPDAGVAVRELERLAIRFVGQVRIEVKLPPGSEELLSRAALAAGEQGKLWLMLERLAHDPDKSFTAAEHHARELGLDMPRFYRALSEGTVLDAVRNALAEARQLDLQSGFVVAGRRFTGPVAPREMAVYARQHLIH